MYDCHSSLKYCLCVSCSLFLCSQSNSRVGVGGVEVIYDIRYSLGEQESPDRLNNHHPLRVLCVSVHFNQEKWLCGPHIAHRGGLGVLIVYTQCTVDVMSVPLNQTTEKGGKRQTVILFFLLFTLTLCYSTPLKRISLIIV